IGPRVRPTPPGATTERPAVIPKGHTTTRREEPPMLRLANVSFSYDTRRRSTSAADPILDRVSMHVDAGELVGILGPNGSGKTTPLKVRGGTLRPASGWVRLEDKPMAEWSRRDIARRIAVVPQETHAPFDFTVLDLVLMGRFPHLGPFTLEGPDDL